MIAPNLSPELYALLTDVVRDTGSKLFQVTSAQRRLQPLESVSVSPATAGLSTTERELVGVHRWELARLVHQAYWILYDPRTARAGRIEHYAPMPDPAVWQQRATRLIERAPTEPTLRDGIAAVRRALRLRRGEGGQLGDLLLVAMRLAETENARNDIALDLIEREQYSTALQLLNKQLASRPSRLFEALAWLNIGHCNGQARWFGAARDAYAMAAGWEEAEIAALVCAFAFSLRTNDVVAAARFAARLDERTTANDPSVALYVRRLARSMLAGTEHASVARQSRGSLGRLGAVSGAIAHAFERQ